MVYQIVITSSQAGRMRNYVHRLSHEKTNESRTIFLEVNMSEDETRKEGKTS